LILAAILIAAGFIAFYHAPEPSYQGKNLTAWIDDYIALNSAFTNQYRFDANKHADIAFAFKEMGTNGITFIFRRLERQDSPIQTRYRDAWSKLPGLLRRVLPNPKPVLDANSAETLIAYAGPVSPEFFLPATKSTSSTVRQVAAERIMHSLHLNVPEAEALLLTPRLIGLLQDSNKMVRLFSAGALGNIGPRASKAVPALILALNDNDLGPAPGSKVYVRAWTATALGKIGPAAASAVPTLQILLTDPDHNVRAPAGVALWKIHGDVETTLPIIIEQLADQSPASKAPWITCLGEMGPRAKAAIPALTDQLNHATGPERDLITNALFKIDPEAAAKLGAK
jgi:hypothetical protein